MSKATDDLRRSITALYLEVPTPVAKDVEIKALAVLEELEEADNYINALQAAGVDNWEGYDHAMDILHG